MNRILLLLMLIPLWAAFAKDDPCNCDPKRGKVPYRLKAKQSLPASHVASRTISADDILGWESRYAGKTKTIGHTSDRLKKTPEDSLYTLEGYMWFVMSQEDCDYHIQIGPQDGASHRAVVEVAVEKCKLQKQIFDKLTAEGFGLGKEFTHGLHCIVKGVGFYDGQHGLKKPSKTTKNPALFKQEGTAWELHPVQSIEFVP